MRFLSLLALLFVSLTLRAEPGVAVLDSKSGEVTVTPQDVKSGEPFDPSGMELHVGPDSFATLVFSNGVAIQLAAETSIRIDEFEQSPFTARPDDFEFEPSRSTLAITLLAGDIGIAQRDQIPTSEFTIQLNEQASASIKAQSASILHTQDSLIAVIFDGHGSIQIDDQNHLFNEDYRFILGDNVDYADRIRMITEEQREAWSPLAAKAAITLRRWYFTTPAKGEIVPVRVALPSVTSSKPYNNTKL